MRAFACRIYASPPQIAHHQCRDRYGVSEPIMRSILADEHPSTWAVWTIALQISGQRPSNIVWQRQLRRAPALPMNRDRRGAPVDITQVEGNHLSCPESQPR